MYWGVWVVRVEFIRVYEVSACTGVYDGVICLSGYIEGVLIVSRCMV